MGIPGQSKRGILLAAACMAGGIALALPHMSRAALLSNVVFNDVLASNGSTFDAAGQSYPNTASPTATSTNYNVAASKDATASTFTSGNPLAIKMVASTSGIAELQAVFASAPVVLTNIGDSVEATVTFTDGAGLNTNSSSAVYFGLYSSGGSAPYNNLGNGSASSGTVGGINNAQVNDNTGGVQGWAGYEADLFGGSKPKLFSRPSPAVGTNNTDQALVGNGQTGGSSGTQATYTSQSSASDPLAASTQYTNELEITLSAAGVYTITENFYQGANDLGTQIGTVTTGPLTALGSGFDGIAVGFRQSANVASEMDINQIEITTNVAVPEPATLGLIGLGCLGLLKRRHRRA